MRVFVDGNNVLLDVICFPPHSIKYGDYHFTAYHDMINYFTVKDCIHLENKPMEQFKQGKLCSKCNKGHLENSAKSEDYTKGSFRRRTKVWVCDFCGQEFKQFWVDTRDEIHFS